MHDKLKMLPVYLHRGKHTSLFTFTLLLCISVSSFPQWSNDPDINLQVTNWGYLPLASVSNYEGGVLISANLRFWMNDTIFASKPYLVNLDRYGYHKWAQPVGYGGTGKWIEKIKFIQDGFGNYLVAFVDMKFIRWNGNRAIWDHKIRVQKLDSLGNQVWGDGVLVSSDTMQQYLFDFTSDSEGGCYLSWTAEYTLDDAEQEGVRAIQRISADGDRLWGDTGIVLYEGEFGQQYSIVYKITSAQDHGLFVRYSPDNDNYYYRKYLNTGTLCWELPVRHDRWNPRMIGDNDGGLVILAFIDFPQNHTTKFIMDRINSIGEYVGESVKTICDTSGWYSEITGIHLGEDDITTFYWRDEDYFNNYSSYFQRIDYEGNKQFTGKGIKPFIGDSYGGILMKSFEDFLVVAGRCVQKITKDGELVWDSIGVLISSHPPPLDYNVVSDGYGGLIMTWLELNNGIWAQQISSNGILGEVITGIDFEVSNNYHPQNIILYQNYPNPFNSITTINYKIEKSSWVELNVYDILGKDIVTLVNQAFGERNTSADRAHARG